MPKDGAVSYRFVLVFFVGVPNCHHFREFWHTQMIQHMGNRLAPSPSECQIVMFVQMLITDYNDPVAIQCLCQLLHHRVIDILAELNT